MTETSLDSYGESGSHHLRSCLDSFFPGSPKRYFTASHHGVGSQICSKFEHTRHLYIGQRYPHNSTRFMHICWRTKKHFSPWRTGFHFYTSFVSPWQYYKKLHSKQYITKVRIFWKFCICSHVKKWINFENGWKLLTHRKHTIRVNLVTEIFVTLWKMVY